MDFQQATVAKKNSVSDYGTFVCSLVFPFFILPGQRAILLV